MKHLYHSLLLITIICSSCGGDNAESETAADQTNTAIAEETIQPEPVLLGCKHTVKDSAGAFFKDSVIDLEQLDRQTIPDLQQLTSGLLLEARGYHGDEVTDEMKKAEWWELSETNGKYQLEKAAISFERFHDGIVDDDTTQKTGVKVSGKNEEAVFLANISGLKAGPVKAITLDTNVILPGTHHMFSFNDIDYRFYASAYYEHSEQEDEVKYITYYKLYLECDKAGVKTTQLVLAQPFYESCYALQQIQYLGDIDRDGKPDFIIDISNHYNVSAPTLFLSGSADKGKLVKAIAMHQSVGC